jgi:GT2 family glycosyltransferase
MNNDVTVYQETFHELRHWWQANPREALLGVATEEASGIIAGLGYVDLLTGRTRSRKPHRYSLPYIHGSFFAAPYIVFMKTQGLTEEYFLYWEDAQLGVRAARRRVPLRVSRRVRVAHHQRPSPARVQDQLYYLVRNGALFLERETPPLWRSYWWLYNRLRLVYHTARPAGSKVVRQALADARRGVTGQRTAAP